MSSKRNKKYESRISGFMKQYMRKRQPGWDSNDRSYDRNLEKKIKRMNPFELDQFLNGENESEE